MPVTVRLSKLFYDRLGEQIADELVNWFNQVDATYRGELREINELNFARFDAKLEQGLATLEARFNERFATLEARVNERFAGLEAKLGTKLDTAVAQHAFAQLEAKIDRGLAELRTTLEKGLKEQTRWQFVAWSALLIPLIVLLIRR